MTASIIPFPHAPWSPIPRREPVILEDNGTHASVEIFGAYTAAELNDLSGELKKLAQRMRKGGRHIGDHESVA